MPTDLVNVLHALGIGGGGLSIAAVVWFFWDKIFPKLHADKAAMHEERRLLSMDEDSFRKAMIESFSGLRTEVHDLRAALFEAQGRLTQAHEKLREALVINAELRQANVELRAEVERIRRLLAEYEGKLRAYADPGTNKPLGA